MAPTASDAGTPAKSPSLRKHANPTIHRGATAQGGRRIQLLARPPRDGRHTGPGARRPVRGYMRNRPSFRSSLPPLTFTLPRNAASFVRATTLLERRIGHQEPFQQAGLQWIGAGEFEWGRGGGLLPNTRCRTSFPAGSCRSGRPLAEMAEGGRGRARSGR